MAKEIFAQMAAGLDSNRKVMKAGRDGRDVFLWVLRQIALRASEGWVPAREVEDSEWLARVLMCKPREARDGLARAIDAELLKLDGDRCYAVGWTPSHGRTAQTGAERQSRYIERKKAESHIASDAPVTAPSAPVTASDGSDGSDEVTQGRKEGKKEKKEDEPAKPTPLKLVPTGPEVPNRKPASGPHAEVIACFTEHYTRAYGTSPTWGPKQGAMVKNLLESHSVDKIRRHIANLFGGRGPSFLNGPYDLGTLVANFDRLADAPRVGGFVDRKKPLS